MVFNPHTGMTPNDWRETEARREESRQRMQRGPHGLPGPGTASMIVGTIIVLAIIAVLLAVASAFWSA